MGVKLLSLKFELMSATRLKVIFLVCFLGSN